MEVEAILSALIPSWSSVILLFCYFGYLAVAGSVLPGKIVPGAVLSDGSRLHYRCNGLLLLLLLLILLPTGVYMKWMPPTVIADKGFELLSTTFILSLIVSLILYATGLKSKNQSSSLRPHVTGDFVHDWWFGVQLNPHFFGIDLKFFFVRAGMMGWLLINLSLLAKSYEAGTTNVSVILYQLFCTLYVLDYFFYKEFMTSTYMIFRGANTQKHVFKKDPKAPIWGKPPNVVGGKLLASGYWGIARHCNYLGDLLLALSFSLLCGASSAIPYFYPTYLLILLIWRERRDEARCSQKYKEIWVE